MTAVMPQINKIVMLMLENRSLDNVLGWLYHDEVLPADRVYPCGSSRHFDGLSSVDVNGIDGTLYAPSQGTHDRYQPLRQPRWNPNEWFANVGNQMYHDGYGHDTVPRWSAATPPMTGFVEDYDAVYDSPGEVMGAFSKDQLPVLYGLAESFAVSDRWFSSVPTETNPNRAFALCGTSLGALDNADIVDYDVPTVFNRLSEADHPKSWGVYYQYNGSLDMDPVKGDPCYTTGVFPHVRRAAINGDGVVDSYDAFLKALSSPDLPDFCFIEPYWGGGYGFPLGNDFLGLQGNDYHPPAWVGPAECDLNELYEALRASPHWDDMLFIVTFDEHGGTYDHVPPPVTVRPDISPAHQPFDFRRMGVRVPTILASPYVQPGTVFRAPVGSAHDFDHTSFIATILQWAGIDPREANMGLRVANAPTFEGVLGDVRHDAPPCFHVPDGYATQGGEKGPHNIPFGIGKMPIQTFRALLDASDSPADFLARLKRAVDSI